MRFVRKSIGLWERIRNESHEGAMPHATVVNLTLLYINLDAVIPAKAGIQPRDTGFRVKPGMTMKGTSD
jgi:hypothetical protein